MGGSAGRRKGCRHRSSLTASVFSNSSSSPNLSSPELRAVAVSSDPIAVDQHPTAANNVRAVFAIAAVVIVLDQVTKIWAVAALDDGAIDLFWTLRFRLIFNTGAAFSLGDGAGRWLGLVVIGVVIAVIFYARSVSDRLPRLLLGMILGGAIGNLIDRIFRAEDGFLSGGVVDFIDLQWWPVFNIADIAVVLGAIGFGLLSLREP